MKKYVFAIAALAASTVALAASVELAPQLNAAVAQLLRPYTNSSTQASITFRSVIEDETHVLSMDLTGLFQKVGPSDTATLRVDSVRYDAGAKGGPASQGNGSLSLNFLKLADQDMINDLVANLPEVVASMVQDKAGKFKDAILVDTKVSDTLKDTAGNVAEVKGVITVEVDFAKLPPGTTREDVPVTGGTIGFDFVPAQGIQLAVTALSNVAYKGFRADQPGLKEYFDRFLSRDDSTLGEANKFLTQVNDFAKRVTGANQ